MCAEVTAQGTATASGWVWDQQGGPVAAATVRVRATTNVTTSGSDGSFLLSGLTEGITVTVTAWQAGYYVAAADVVPPATSVTLLLRPLHTSDNPSYEWLSPDPAQGHELNCGNCHGPIMSQWENNAHAGAVSNPRFSSLYNGTDISGARDIGPGFKLDFPETAGNCATCHAPAAALDAPFSTDMNAVRDDITSGIFCDFCHKIGGAFLNPASGAPYPNVPGVLSLDLRRPPDGDQVFFGPYDDVPDPDTYLPLMKESGICAPCHSFSFWGTPIYQSFDEWLASPYSEQGVTCQVCHMAPTGQTHFVLPEQGGLEHPPETIPSHLQPGASDEPLLQNTVSMTLTTRQPAGSLEVVVTITNTQGGHHVPTDHPGRNMILVVRAEDEAGHELRQLSGPVVPDWGGAGDAENDFAGRPGKGFAKVLRDATSGEWPVVNYWKPTFIVSDNRIAAQASDISSYRFTRPATGAARVLAELWFRRLFIDQVRAKDWETPDLLMASAETVVPASAFPHHVLLPLIIRE
jgi:hypothetical protein